MNRRNEAISLLSDGHAQNARRAPKRRVTAESKVRIVLEGLQGQTNIAALCRREGISERLYYSWAREFIEAGKQRLMGDRTGVQAISVTKELRRQLKMLKEVLADQALELHEFRKCVTAVNENGSLNEAME